MTAKKIRNNFKILRAQKEKELGRNLTYTEIYQITGVSPTILSGYATGSINRYDGDTLVRLCEFFNCSLSDLLEFAPE
jgi:DNA-binding Xre family transcriptional regulator